MDYYKILGVDIDASEEVIKAAYKAMAKKYHPDTYKGDPMNAEKRMKDINIAFETLMNKESRARYNNQVRNAQKEDPKEKKV